MPSIVSRLLHFFGGRDPKFCCSREKNDNSGTPVYALGRPFHALGRSFHALDRSFHALDRSFHGLSTVRSETVHKLCIKIYCYSRLFLFKNLWKSRIAWYASWLCTSWTTATLRFPNAIDYRLVFFLQRPYGPGGWFFFRCFTRSEWLKGWIPSTFLGWFGCGQSHHGTADMGWF